jgi:hypothetical protein
MEITVNTSHPTAQSTQSIPTYWVSDAQGRSVPVMVSLLFYDAQGSFKLPPATQRAIDKTVQITHRAGLLMGTVLDTTLLNKTVRSWLEQALYMPNVSVLFSCQSLGCAQGVMAYLADHYVLSLVRSSSVVGVNAQDKTEPIPQKLFT